MFHFFNLFFHALNAMLVFSICGRLLKKSEQRKSSPEENLLAGSLAMAFALNYSLSESVYWIACITSLLEAFFILLVCYFYLRFLNSRRGRFLFIAIVLFSFGLGAKEGVFLLVGIIPMLALIYEFRLPRRYILFSWLGFWSVGAVYLVIVQRVLRLTSQPTVYAYSWGWSLFRNLQQFWLSLIYHTPFNDHNLYRTELRMAADKVLAVHFDGWVILGVLGLIFLVYLAWRGNWPTRVALAMTTWVMLPFSLPQLALCGWFRYPFPFRTYYLPMLFFVLLLAIFVRMRGWSRIRSKALIVAALLIIIAVVGGLRTWKRGDDWIVVGRQYTYVLSKLQKKVAAVLTPLLALHIHDPESRNDYRRGIFTNFTNGLYPLFYRRHIDVKQSDVVRERHFSSYSEAVEITPEEMAQIRSGQLTVLVYSGRLARFLIPPAEVRQ